MNYYESEVDTRVTRARLAFVTLVSLGLWALILKVVYKVGRQKP